MKTAPTISIYALLRDGVIVYVGRSCTLRDRLSHHRSTGKVFDAHQILATTTSRSEATKIEGDWIARLSPAYNNTTSGAGNFPAGDAAKVKVSLTIDADIVRFVRKQSALTGASVSFLLNKILRAELSLGGAA